MTNIELQELLAKLPPELPILLEIEGEEYISDTLVISEVEAKNGTFKKEAQYIVIHGDARSYTW